MTSVPGRTRPAGTMSVCLLPSFSTVTFSCKATVWSLICPGWSARAMWAQPDRRAMLTMMRMDFISLIPLLWLIDLDLELDDLGSGAARHVAQLHRHRPGGGDVVIAGAGADGGAVQQQAAGDERGVGRHGIRDHHAARRGAAARRDREGVGDGGAGDRLGAAAGRAHRGTLDVSERDLMHLVGTDGIGDAAGGTHDGVHAAHAGTGVHGAEAATGGLGSGAELHLALAQISGGIGDVAHDEH